MRELLRVGDGFDLGAVDPSSTPGVDLDKSEGREALAEGAAELATLQELMWANSRHGDEQRVLLVLQAMDTAGKGGIVRHVVGAVDPLGVRIAAFKAPTEEEKAHDFLWRIRKRLPQPGELGVFDRSHYEDVLIHRVRGLSSPEVVEERYGLINDFERDLVAGGTRVVKVMLHISNSEQRERLAERLDRADKHWKYSPGDVDERQLWPAYMEAYQLALTRTSTPEAPWFVVPADRKWYARLAVQHLLRTALEDIDPQWPAATYDIAEQRARLAAT